MQCLYCFLKHLCDFVRNVRGDMRGGGWPPMDAAPSDDSASLSVRLAPGTPSHELFFYNNNPLLTVPTVQYGNLIDVNASRSSAFFRDITLRVKSNGLGADHIKARLFQTAGTKTLWARRIWQTIVRFRQLLSGLPYAVLSTAKQSTEHFESFPTQIYKP